ncbi:MAG: hypothetical protein AAF513_09175 [Pseudomonadota bacterium]
MKSLALLLWHICTFKAGPDVLPAQRNLFVFLLICNLLLSIIAQVLVNEIQILRAITASFINVAILLGLMWMMLRISDKASRYLQSATALIGTDIILTAAALVGIALGQVLPDVFVSLVGLASLFWTFAVFGFIYHRAMDINIIFGVALAFFVVIFAFATSQAFTVPNT